MKRIILFQNTRLIKIIGLIILLSILTIFFYSNRIFLSGINPPEDTRESDIPNASFFIKTVQLNHKIPLWDPYKICGLPFFEISFMGPYYPLVFLYSIFPILKVINLGFIIHILLSGVFMFFLSKELNFTKLISFFCASSWMLSSVFQQYSESGWLPETISGSYLPLFILFLIKISKSNEKQKIILGLLTSLTLAFTITGGHYCYTLISIYSFLIFALPFLKQKKNILLLLFILLTAGLLSIIAWGPLLIQLTKTGKLEKLATQSYKINELMNFLFPINIRRGFTGRLVVILAFIGIFIKKSPFRINFMLLLLFSLVFMLGSEIKLGNKELIDIVPFANQVHYPWAWHISFIFSLIIFSGFSLDKLRLRFVNNKRILLIILNIFIAIQLADLYYFNRKFYPRVFQFTYKEFFYNSPFIDFLKKDRSLYRLCNRFYDHPTFRTNQGMLDGINCFESRVRGVSLYRINDRGDLTHQFSECPSGKLMDICNVKYIITRQDDLNRGRFSKVLKVGEAYLYRNNFSYPRAFLLENINRTAIQKLLLNNYTNPLLEINIPEETIAMLATYKSLDVKYYPNIYKISLECKSDSFLFLSEMFDSGWRAEIDGVWTKIVAPFNFFMGIYLPPGEHSVIFKFNPLYFHIFYVISIITFLMVVFVLLYLNKKSRISRPTWIA